MAQPRPLKHKDGTIYAYQLRYFRGKGIKDYSKTVRIPEGMKSPRSIDKWLREEQGKFEIDCKQGITPVERKTFRDYAEYVMKLKEKTMKKGGIAKARDLLKRLYPEIGFYKLDEITPTILNNLYLKFAEPGQNLKTGEGLSPKTILEYHRIIHMIYEFAFKEGFVPFNVADRATPPKAVKHDVNTFEPEQVLEIMEALKTEPLEWQCIVNLLISAGIRRGEAMGLKWENIDFENKTIYVCLNVQYHPGDGIYVDTPKTGQTRYIGIPDDVVELLKTYRREQGILRYRMGSNWEDTGFCFTNENGNVMNPDSVTKWLARFSKRHGLPHINPHAFRHTQASVLIANGVDVVDVSKRLGHAQVSTTMNIYAHQFQKGDPKTTDVISGIFYNSNENKETKEA